MIHFNNCLYNNICFGCVKEMSQGGVSLHTQNLCLIVKTLIIIIFGGYIFYVNLPIIQTIDNVK